MLYYCQEMESLLEPNVSCCGQFATGVLAVDGYAAIVRIFRGVI